MRKLQAFPLPMDLTTFTLPIPPDSKILGVYETIDLPVAAVLANIERAGIRVVARIPCQPRISKISRAYMQTKQTKMGHLLGL